jgi:NADH dehydrogenase FAD-containing subunit
MSTPSEPSSLPVHEIVLLGAHHIGLSCTHYLLRHVMPALTTLTNKQYHLTIVAPHTDYFWNPASPRHVVENVQMTTEKMFTPILPALEQYDAKHYEFVVGKATIVSKDDKTVKVKGDAGERVIQYGSLIIATGIASNSTLWQINESQDVTKAEFDSVRMQLATAKTAVIVGGGPTGVETAGEIASKYPDMDVTLYSGSTRVLSRLTTKNSAKAQARLEKLGIAVVHGMKSSSMTKNDDGTTTIKFTNNEIKTVDVYIDATGGQPNTGFPPKEWLNERGYVTVNALTCRVIEAEGVYAAGDCASNSDGSIASGAKGIAPTCLALAHDIAKLHSVKFPIAQKKASLLPICAVPIGPSGGVGQAFGYGLPSFLVKSFKCKDYLLSLAPGSIKGDGQKKP